MNIGQHGKMLWIDSGKKYRVNEGVSKYESDKGVKLSYYASWWIKSYILKFILDNFRLVKLGPQMSKEVIFQLNERKEPADLSGINPDNKQFPKIWV